MLKIESHNFCFLVELINNTCQSLTTFFISGLLGGNKILLIGNIVEQEFTMAYDWHLGSGLSLVLMVFIVINMAVTAYFDRSEGQVKK